MRLKKKKEIKGKMSPEAVLLDVWTYESLTAKLSQNKRNSTVWLAALLVTSETDISNVQSLKIHRSIREHTLETKAAEMSAARNLFVMIPLRVKAKCQERQAIQSLSLCGQTRSKLGGVRWTRQQSAVQSSRQDLKRKVWLFEWFD